MTLDQTDVMDALLDSVPPTLTDDQAIELAQHYFGVSGWVKRLTSERDLNFCLTDAQGRRFVLKLANPAEQPAITAFQTAALLHLADVAPDLPVPRVMRTQDGATETRLPNGSTLRLLTYVEGAPLHAARPTPAQRASMGQMGATLARALRGFDHPAASHDLLWDIKQAARLRGLLPSIADTDLRALAASVLDRFDQGVAPALPTLRWQVVHNDLNPHNVLVDPENPDRIAGILDFGDMVRTPLICDVAIAASYQIDPADPVGSLADFTGAWHRVDPLLPAELDHLFDLVATRMITTLAITSWRAARYPDNAPYILRNFATARAGLIAFASLSRDDVRNALARTCQEIA